MSDDAEKPVSSSGAGAGASFSMGMQMGGGMDDLPDYAPSPEAPAPVAGGVVKDVTSQSFMADVIEASRNGPVVVDFWAPWCGPCKQLGPVIEKAVSQAGGSVTLCKMDIEQYPDVAQQMGIQSIPAVIAFVDGRPADAFMGAKPESEVKAFIDKLAAANPTTEGADMAEALRAADEFSAKGEHGDAAEIYSQILAQEPGNIDAFAGLGQCYIAVGEVDVAEKLIDKVPQEHHEEPPLAALIKAIALAKQGAEMGDLTVLAAAVEKDPKGHQARFDYALALNANGDREEAAEQLVAIVRADRKWNDDGARKQLVDLFEVWGNSDPATLAGRRGLSSVLFS